VLAQRWGGGSVGSLRRLLAPGFLLMALGYALFSAAPNLPLAAAAVAVAHFGGSMQWVFSTALIQLAVPGRLQGRVFGIELTVHTLTASLSSYLTGRAADAGWGPRALSLILATLFLPPALLLGVTLWRRPPARPEL
jgi:hypothetical protein